MLDIKKIKIFNKKNSHYFDTRVLSANLISLKIVQNMQSIVYI